MVNYNTVIIAPVFHGQNEWILIKLKNKWGTYELFSIISLQEVKINIPPG